MEAAMANHGPGWTPEHHWEDYRCCRPGRTCPCCLGTCPVCDDTKEYELTDSGTQTEEPKMSAIPLSAVDRKHRDNALRLVQCWDDSGAAMRPQDWAAKLLLDFERASMEREDWRGRCEPDIFLVGDRVQSQYGETVIFGTVTQVLAPPLYMIQFADGKEECEDGSFMRLVSKVQPPGYE